LRAFDRKTCSNWAGLIRKNNCASSLIVGVKWKAKVLDLEVSHVDNTEYDSLTAFLTELQIRSLNAEGAT
jgi:hypothetical protein